MKNLKNILLFSLLGFSLLIESSNAKIKVITTLQDHASIAQYIGGEMVEVKSIAVGYQDPHFVDAKPSYIIQLKNADLFVQNGMEIEIGWAPQLLQGSRNPKIQLNGIGFVDASRNIPVQEVPAGKIDRTMGDVHPYGNPHYWLDPLNGTIIATNITEGLKRVDSANANYYQSNLDNFKNKIYVNLFGQALVEKVGGNKLASLTFANKLDDFLKQSNLTPLLGGWLKKIEPYKGTQIITYHKSWSYFANRFGLVVTDQVEPKPGIPSPPNHIIDLIKLINQEKIKIIIMEPYFSNKVPNLIASKTGVKVLKLPPSVGGDKSVTDYIGLFDYNLDMIINALK